MALKSKCLTSEPKFLKTLPYYLMASETCLFWLSLIAYATNPSSVTCAPTQTALALPSPTAVQSSEVLLETWSPVWETQTFCGSTVMSLDSCMLKSLSCLMFFLFLKQLNVLACSTSPLTLVLLLSFMVFMTHQTAAKIPKHKIL